MAAPHQPLVRKYTPTRIQDLVLPKGHNLASAIKFVGAPYSSAWLLYGNTGLGKTSLANIMAAAAAGHPEAVIQVDGGDLNAESVREIALSLATPPKFGPFHAVVVDQSDSIPEDGQVRLLSVLDKLGSMVWIFTAEATKNFGPRFLSRVKYQLFTSQNVCPAATLWLLTIAKRENIRLSEKEAKRIVQDSRNDLRASLEALDLLSQQK